MTECSEKTGRYRTGALARRALDNIRSRPYEKREKKPVDCYQCEQCNYWHLTSSPR